MAASLAFLCLGILMSMFLPSVVLFQEQSSVAEAQQVATVLLDRIKAGIQSTAPETVGVTPDNHTISWRPCDLSAPFSAQGGPSFHSRFDVYSWDPASREVRFTPWVPSGYTFTNLQPLTPAELPTGPTGQTRVVARAVTKFQVSYPAPYVLIEVTVSPPSPHRQPTWTLRQKLMPRLSS